MKNITVRTVVAIGIGSALFFLLARFLSIPVFANTTLTFQYSILAFFAAVYGPVAGLLIGLIGHTLTDLSWGYGVWWSWVLASAVCGFLFGFLLKGSQLREGNLGSKGIVRFVIGSAIVLLISWGLVAPALDIAIYQEPANKVFVQGAIAAAGNIVTTITVGTALIVAYAKTRTKSQSL